MALAEDNPYAFSTHSRGSSGNSEYPTPSTPTFSIPEHSRLASSTSSLASTPPCDRMDSPTLPPKSVLHDLAEDPSERDDGLQMASRARAPSLMNDESDFYAIWPTRTNSRTSCDYDLSDDFHTDSDYPPESPRTRRGSGEDGGPPATTLKARLSQRMPSLPRRLREKRSYTSLNFQGVRSAPASRAPSIRSPSISKPNSSAIDVTDFATDSPPIPALPTRHVQPAQLHIPESSLPEVDEPIDRKTLASTPLLPPCMMERNRSDTAFIQSPLQSPSVAEPIGFNFGDSSTSTPLASNVQSPILSSKASMVSLSGSRASQARSSADLHASIEKLAEGPFDKWADRLGHANFEISPVPYAPIACDLEACKALTADWELARKRYFNHASTVSEDYGPTSNTFKLTEEKWAAIDAQWKQNFDLTVARAKSCGVDVDTVPCLSESTALAKIPTIDGPDSKGKCMTLADNGEIVGPMVTYVSRIKPQSKKNSFMRFFSDLRLTTS
ncbi:hypothetical protein K461DRAFT_270201 [Myriangium duriaei CBS 260.36]|uniref:Uncharacterized protein n=1 Tax=Myriangium duriaei CBS 260.36 TaxID=1168546 RepID=A0A9P4MKH4_9PEZI|nr:hypothetical protein K461DRAFT_270201 [Myriangium duriaei CBS 260.36]